MKEYYECHITVADTEFSSSILIEEAIKRQKWKFSAIADDPDLGDGIRYYATRHFPRRIEKNDLIFEMNRVSALIREFSQGRILRKKIELIIYDDKPRKSVRNRTF